MPATEVDDLAALLAGTSSALAALMPASRCVHLYFDMSIIVYMSVYIHVCMFIYIYMHI